MQTSDYSGSASKSEVNTSADLSSMILVLALLLLLTSAIVWKGTYSAKATGSSLVNNGDGEDLQPDGSHSVELGTVESQETDVEAGEVLDALEEGGDTVPGPKPLGKAKAKASPGSTTSRSVAKLKKGRKVPKEYDGVSDESSVLVSPEKDHRTDADAAQQEAAEPEDLVCSTGPLGSGIVADLLARHEKQPQQKSRGRASRAGTECIRNAPMTAGGNARHAASDIVGPPRDRRFVQERDLLLPSDGDHREQARSDGTAADIYTQQLIADAYRNHKP